MYTLFESVHCERTDTKGLRCVIITCYLKMCILVVFPSDVICDTQVKVFQENVCFARA